MAGWLDDSGGRMEILIYALGVVFGAALAVYVGWFWFAAVMAFRDAKKAGRLTKNTIIAAYPGVFVGYLYDVIVLNLIGSIWLWSFPRLWRGEWTLTAHLSRLMKESSGTRLHKATIICHNMLHPLDQGHCD